MEGIVICKMSIEMSRETRWSEKWSKEGGSGDQSFPEKRSSAVSLQGVYTVSPPKGISLLCGCTLIQLASHPNPGAIMHRDVSELKSSIPCHAVSTWLDQFESVGSVNSKLKFQMHRIKSNKHHQHSKAIQLASLRYNSTSSWGFIQASAILGSSFFLLVCSGNTDRHRVGLGSTQLFNSCGTPW